jgi:hypothetical protein
VPRHYRAIAGLSVTAILVSCCEQTPQDRLLWHRPTVIDRCTAGREIHQKDSVRVPRNGFNYPSRVSPCLKLLLTGNPRCIHAIYSPLLSGLLRSTHVSRPVMALLIKSSSCSTCRCTRVSAVAVRAFL